MTTLSPENFDYALDERLIAQEPLPQRDLSRLMVLRRFDGSTCHRTFRDLPQLLRPGDLMVLNDTSVIPAKFFARRPSGGRIEGLFIRQDSPGQWLVLLKNAQKCRLGEQLRLEGAPDVRLELHENLREGQYRLAVHPPVEAAQVLGQAGLTPLPPYIRRAAGTACPQDTTDRSRYQTVYAATPGAVAAPTAGLHFTPELLEDIRKKGIQTIRLTLHVGMGTFLPVKCDDLKNHKMHSEWYELSAGAAESLNLARREGRRIVAVGTTAVRVLETIARAALKNAARAPADLFAGRQGWTDIFLHPPCSFHAVDALITNFHLPRSTLLMLVAAFCSPGKTDGVGTILKVYEEAVRLQYRFFSYGDAMLIE